MSTKIEWTVTVQPDGTVTPGETWNPIRAARPVGGPDDPIGWHCERVSPGCEHCYPETINQRRFGTGLPYNRKSRDLVRIGIDDATLAKPLQWRKPRKIFTCSMTDLFAEWVTDDMLDRIFAVMALAPQHTFQLLTKRPERMRAYMNDPATTLRVVHASDTPDGERRIPLGCWNWPLRNVWAGTSVENQAMADLRIPELLATPAAVHYLSMEPLLGPVDVSQFTSYYPLHEQEQTGRGMDLRNRASGGTGNRFGGADLEGRQARLGSVEGEYPDEFLSSPSSGEAHADRIPHGQGDGRQDAPERTGPSARVETLQRPHSRGTGDQPSERRQGGQSPGELGSGDALGERSPRNQNSRGGSVYGSERDDEPRSQTDDGSGVGHSRSTRGGRTTDEHRSGLWDSDANGVEARAWRQSHLWLVVGGESGPKARPCNIEWIRDIVAQCQGAHVPVFTKQDSGPRPGMQGRIPDELWLKEFPPALQGHEPFERSLFGRSSRERVRPRGLPLRMRIAQVRNRPPVPGARNTNLRHGPT